MQLSRRASGLRFVQYGVRADRAERPCDGQKKEKGELWMHDEVSTCLFVCRTQTNKLQFNSSNVFSPKKPSILHASFIQINSSTKSPTPYFLGLPRSRANLIVISLNYLGLSTRIEPLLVNSQPPPSSSTFPLQSFYQSFF